MRTKVKSKILDDLSFKTKTGNMPAVRNGDKPSESSRDVGQTRGGKPNDRTLEVGDTVYILESRWEDFTLDNNKSTSELGITDFTDLMYDRCCVAVSDEEPTACGSCSPESPCSPSINLRRTEKPAARLITYPTEATIEDVDKQGGIARYKISKNGSLLSSSNDGNPWWTQCSGGVGCSIPFQFYTSERQALEYTVHRMATFSECGRIPEEGLNYYLVNQGENKSVEVTKEVKKLRESL